VVARLLDAPSAREVLVRGGTAVPLTVIVSQHFYDGTVPHGYPGIERESFRRIAVTVKEFAADAWLWLPPTPELRLASEDLGQPSREERSVASAMAPRPGQPMISVGRNLSGAVVLGNGNSVQVRQAARQHQ